MEWCCNNTKPISVKNESSVFVDNIWKIIWQTCSDFVEDRWRQWTQHCTGQCSEGNGYRELFKFLSPSLQSSYTLFKFIRGDHLLTGMWKIEQWTSQPGQWLFCNCNYYTLFCAPSTPTHPPPHPTHKEMQSWLYTLGYTGGSRPHRVIYILWAHVRLWYCNGGLGHHTWVLYDATALMGTTT